MRLPRFIHRLYARASGYFWLPCPSCGKHFGGHEAHWPPIQLVAHEPGGGKAVCPACYRNKWSGWSS